MKKNLTLLFGFVVVIFNSAAHAEDLCALDAREARFMGTLSSACADHCGNQDAYDDGKMNCNQNTGQWSCLCLCDGALKGTIISPQMPAVNSSGAIVATSGGTLNNTVPLATAPANTTKSTITTNTGK